MSDTTAAPAAAATEATTTPAEADAAAAAPAAATTAADAAEDALDAKKVTLVSKEGDKFEVAAKEIKISKLVETFLANDAEEGDSEEDDPSAEIPLPQVETVVLTKVRIYALRGFIKLHWKLFVYCNRFSFVRSLSSQSTIPESR